VAASQSGTGDELMALDGRCAELFTLQAEADIADSSR
jgi:hypothetical protein